MTQDKPIRHAATVLVLRQSDQGIEVFMVKRSSKSSFMPDVYVYPGGALDEKDCTLEAFEHSEGLRPQDVQAMFGAACTPAFGVGLLLAGVRETFEEAGFLLARRQDESESIDLMQDAQVTQTFKVYRKAVHSGSMDMLSFAREAGLLLQLEQLEYFARWITPTFESKRFDARFFVARAPLFQRPIHDKQETTESTWMTPQKAIDAYHAGEISLAPPTLATLMELSVFETVDDVFDFCKQTHPATILPHLETVDNTTHLIFPNDVAYPEDTPEYAAASKGGPWARMWMDDGVWRVVRAQDQSIEQV